MMDDGLMAGRRCNITGIRRTTSIPEQSDTGTDAVSMVVQSETVTIPAGRIRYHYDDGDDRHNGECCRAVLILGVGTCMTVGDYDKVSGAILEADSSIVVVIVDASPGRWFTKQNSIRFARLSNEIVNRFTDIVPVCDTMPTHGFIVGGHSSGGCAAMGALKTKKGSTLYDFEPSGLFGLDPYRVDSYCQVSIPGMYWGFVKTTCLVSVDKAAKAAYEASEKDKRVLYAIRNDARFFHNPPSHCVFTDEGCAHGICPVDDEQAWIRSSIGKSFGHFVKAIEDGSFDRGQFDLKEHGILLFVNGDDANLQ